MAIQQTTLPSPVGNGYGAWTDISTYGALKTILCNGGVRCFTEVEISNEAAPLAGTVGSAITSFGNEGHGNLTLQVSARWARVKVAGFITGVSVAPVVTIGGDDSGAVFATVPSLNVDGFGAAVDTTSLVGPVKTITVIGEISGQINFQISQDGVTWEDMFTFGGSPTSVTAEFVANWCRIQKSRTVSVLPAPAIDIGGSFGNGGGGGGGGSVGYTLQAFNYICDGTEGSDFMIPIVSPTVSSTYFVQLTQAEGIASSKYFNAPTGTPGDRTTTDFRVISSSAVAAGDSIDVYIFEYPVVAP